MPFNLFTAFHANLAYSSIPESHYGWILDTCYWPLLDLCKSLRIAMGVEFSGHTLRKLSEIDPLFIRTLKDLIRDGLVEPICGGEHQSIGPLMPPADNSFNYRKGKDTFRALLDWDARLLFLPEQTVSRGVLDAVVETGFRSVLLEWNNVRKYGNRGLPDGLLYGSPRLVAPNSRTLRILWNHSVVFQKVQRYVFGDIPMKDAASYIKKHATRGDGCLCFYGSDLEVFGYHPGRTIQKDPRLAEERWERFKKLVARIHAEHPFVSPSAIADRFPLEETVRVGAAASPILCKKQPKYNPVRWAVCGRGASRLNTQCYRLSLEIDTMKEAGLIDRAEETRLRNYLAPCWASDYRTFTTEEKWTRAGRDIARAHSAQMEVKRDRISRQRLAPGEILFIGGRGETKGPRVYDLEVQFPPGFVQPGARAMVGGQPAPTQWEEVQRHRDGSIRQAHLVVILDPSSRPLHKIHFAGCDMALEAGSTEFRPELKNDHTHISWNTRRGLCIDSATFPSVFDLPVLGTIPHGFFDSIDWDADFYTGGVQLDDGHNFYHDLEAVSHVRRWAGPIRDIVEVAIPAGPIVQKKRYAVYHHLPRIDIEQSFQTRGVYSLAFRAGIVTLLPGGWRGEKLTLTTRNGGKSNETYPLHGEKVAHSDPSKIGVSSSNCLGATDGWLAFGDGEKTLTISRDMTRNYTAPLIKYEEIGPHFFARVYHTLGERDETSLFTYRGHLSTRFALTASPGRTVSPGYEPFMALQATSVEG